MRKELKFLTCYDIYLLCVIALIKILDRSASARLGLFFACSTGLTAWWLSRGRRRSRLVGLARALVASEAEIPQIAKNCFYQCWHSVFSVPSHCRERSTRLDAELRGLDNMRKALAKGKGVILWESNGFGKRLLAKRILHENGLSVIQVHGEHHLGGFHNSKSWIATKIIQPFFENYERPFVKEIIYLSDSGFSFNRTLLEHLKRNAILCIAADGSQGYKFVALPFLGSRQLFSTGMVNMARLSGASILPLFCISEKMEKAILTIEAPIDIDVNGDRENGVESSVRQYARLLETYVRRYPEQYSRWESSLGDESISLWRV